MRTSFLPAFGLAMALTTLSSVAYAGPPCGDISIRTKEIVMESSSEEGVIRVHILRSDGSYVKALGPGPNAGDSVFVSTMRPGKCDLRLQYAGTADTTATDPEPADYLLPELTERHTFVVEDAGAFSGNRSFTYSHDRRADSERALSFFAPNLKTWAGNSDLYVETTSSGLRFSFLSMWAASGHSTRYIDEFFAADDWIFPYQMDYVCNQINNCTPKDAYDVGVFLSPQTVPLGADPNFLINSVGLDRTTSTITTPVVDRWFDSDLTLRFANGARLTISDTLDVKGVTFMGLTSSSNWSGLRLESGGTVTLSNQATIDHAGIVVLNGSLTLDNADVLDAPVHGVYASGSSSSILIKGDSEISGSVSSGVETANYATATIEGQSTVEGSGFANIRARGVNAKVYVKDALVVGGNGDALLADSGGNVVLDSSPTTSSFVARINDYKKGARSETFATVQSGSGGDRLVQNSTHSSQNDVIAQDEAALYITNNFWGSNITHFSQLAVYNPGGESIVLLHPVSTSDPGATVREELPSGTAFQVAGAQSYGASTPVVRAGEEVPNSDEGLGVLSPFASQIGMGTTQGWVESTHERQLAADASGAIDAMIEAFDAAETEQEQRMAWGGAIRFAANLGYETALADATAHARFTAFISGALGNPDTAPWAHRTLAVYAMSHDRGTARGHIEALIASRQPVEALVPYADGRKKLSHAAFGQLLRAQMAVEDRDEATALDALAELAVLDSYQADAEGVGLEIVFPGADVRGTVARARQRAVMDFAKAEAVSSETITRLHVAPNPSAGRIRLSVDLTEVSEVEVAVYDALGRRVATAMQGSLGAGLSEIDADLSTLPAGIYVARLQVAGMESPQTARFTISR